MLRRPAFAIRDLRALSGAVLYAVVNGVEAVLQLIVIPFVTRSVPVRIFGQFALLYVSLPVLLILSDVGSGLAAVRYIARTPEADERKRIITSLFWPRAVLAPALATLLFLAASPLDWETISGPESRAALPFVALAFVTMSLYDATVELLRGQERHREAATAMFLRSALRAVALLVFVTIHRCDLRSIFGSLAIANGVGLVIAASRLRGQMLGRPSLRLYWELVKFGAPMCMMFIVRIVLDLDRYLVRALTSVSAAGLYQLAGFPGMGVDMMNRIGAYPIEPYVYGAKPEARARALARVTRLFVFAVGAVAFSLGCFAPELLRVLAPPEYAGAIAAVPPLLFAGACSGVTRIVGIGAGAAGRPRAWAIASVVEFCTTVALMVLVGARFQFAGIAAMRLCGAVVGLTVCYAISYRVWPVRLPVARGIAFFLLAATATSLTTGAWGFAALALWKRALVWAVVTGAGAGALATFRLPPVATIADGSPPVPDAPT